MRARRQPPALSPARLRRARYQRARLKWKAKDSRFQCPKHKSRCEPDGTFISGRATRGMDRHPLRKEGDSIVVDLTTLHKEDEQRALWAAAVIRA